MNWLDLIILLPLVGGLFSGFKNGLIGEVASLAALILGIVGSIKLSDMTANLLHTWGLESQYMHIISFVITFIIIVVVVQLIAKMISQLLKTLLLGWLDKLLGIIFGVIKAALIISVLLFVLDIFDERKPIIPEDVKENSILYQPMSNIVPGILPFLHLEDIGDDLKKRDREPDTVNT